MPKTEVDKADGMAEHAKKTRWVRRRNSIKQLQQPRESSMKAKALVLSTTRTTPGNYNNNTTTTRKSRKLSKSAMPKYRWVMISHWMTMANAT